MDVAAGSGDGGPESPTEGFEADYESGGAAIRNQSKNLSLADLQVDRKSQFSIA